MTSYYQDLLFQAGNAKEIATNTAILPPLGTLRIFRCARGVKPFSKISLYFNLPTIP